MCVQDTCGFQAKQLLDIRFDIKPKTELIGWVEINTLGIAEATFGIGGYIWTGPEPSFGRFASIFNSTPAQLYPIYANETLVF